MSDGIGGLIQAVGQGIVGLIEAVFDTIGSILRGIGGQVGAMAPLPLILVVGMAVLLLLAWNFARR